MRDYPIEPSPHFRRCIFLDRDGTINVDTHFPHRLSDLEFFPTTLSGLRVLANLPFDIIVVSNQAGIALGYYRDSEMSEFNTELRIRVEHAGGRIDAFYYCPYLEAKHLPVSVSPNPCSKPLPGMLHEAASDFELTLPQCFLIGDRYSDIFAGKAVRCTTILIAAGNAEQESKDVIVRPDYHASDLYEAALLVKSIVAYKQS